MNSNWNSSTTEVLLNPRISAKDRELYSQLLLTGQSLPRHLWFTTSGTSGRFKFVAVSKEAILCSAQAVNAHFQSNANDTWINVLPTFHVGGVGIIARSYLSGAKIVDLYNKKIPWTPKEFVHAIQQYNATLSALVPTQVHDLVTMNAQAPASMRAVIIGGGVLDHSLYTKAESLGWKLFPSYGMTECSSQVATCEYGQSNQYKILSHVEVKINDEGFINLKSDSLFSTYAFIEGDKISFKDPKVDGWFKTEDLGEREGTYLKVLGRNSDFLKISGESVSLLAVQRNLDNLKFQLGIQEDIVLVPQKHERLGEVISLCVEGNISGKVEILIDMYNKTAMPYERIYSIHSVDTIPRNHMGKLLRDKLMDRIKSLSSN